VSADDPNAPVTVSITIEPADLKAFMRYFTKSSSFAPLRRLRLGYLALVFIDVIALASGSDHLSGWATLTTVAVLACVVVIARRCRAIRFEMSKPAFDGVVSADAEGLTIHRPHTTIHSTWTAFDDITVTPAHIMLRTSPLTGAVVPVRCFRDLDDKHRFLTFATNARSNRGLAPTTAADWGPPGDL